MNNGITFNIASALMIVVVFAYFVTQYDTSKKSSKCFVDLLICIFATSILDIACNTLSKVGLDSIANPLNIVYCLCIVGCAFIFTEYTRVITAIDGKFGLGDKINYLLVILYAVLVIANTKYHFFMTFSDGEIVKGPAYVLIFVLSGYYLLFAIFKMILNFGILNKKEINGVFSFVAVTFTGALLQYFVFAGFIFIYFVYALACLILLFAFETPDYQKMIAATEELRINKEKLEISKQREEDLTRTNHQLMKTSSWYIGFDKDGVFKEAYWSEEIRTLLGYSPEDDIDVPNLWTNSLHPEDKERAMNAFMNGLQGKEYRTEARLRFKDGSYQWFLCTGSLHTDSEGKPVTYQGLIQNIDDEVYKRELIEERLKVMADLEKSEADLQKALFDAQEANRAKTTFLSNMSHDIRTPMNAIIGYTQLAKENIDKKEEVTDCLNTIQSSGTHLLSLINDVLDMSRIESGKVKVEPTQCDLFRMISEIEMLTKANVSERHQTYETIVNNLTDPYVMCDRLRLNQVLLNCVGNSVKYTPEGGHIKVELTQNDTDKENVKEFTFKIIDNGIGMSEEFLKHVFEPFERAKDSTTSNIQGTGLGMAITQNLVQIMGGSISAESELGKGSTFIIRIPLPLISKDEYEESRKTVAGDLSIEEMTKALAGKKFLVVDDNKINRTIVKKLFTERGMIVDECESGIKAIEIARTMQKDSYDMIFMDVKMPLMDGYEATDSIRKLDNDIAKTIPIIAMTADAFEEDKKKAKEYGMNGHVTKPFKIDELIHFLYGLFERNLKL